jgi:hypothetical protein
MYQNNIFFILKKSFLKLVRQNNSKHTKKIKYFKNRVPKQNLYPWKAASRGN